jgi:O-antigen ligase
LTPLFSGLALALLAVGWLTTEHIPPWVSWHSEAAVFAGAWLLALAAVATGLRLQGHAAAPIALPRPALVLVFLGVLAVLQGLAGIAAFSGDVLVFCLYLALACACLALGFHTQPGPAAVAGGVPRAVVWLAWTFVAGSCASTLVALAQVFDLWIATGWVALMPELRRPGGNLAQPNQLATLLLMGGASVLLLMQARPLRGGAVAVLLAFLCLGLAMTESRAGFVGFFVLLGWWLARRKALFPQVSAWAGFAAAVGFVALFVAWPNFLETLGLLKGTATGRLGHVGLRLSLWQQMVDAVLQKPWLGWGVLDVAEAHNAVVSRYPESDALSYAHNLVIDLFVWFGAPAALVVCAVAAVWAVRRLLEARALTPWYCLAVALPLAVHSMLEFPYAYAYFLAPVAFLFGVLEAARGARPWLRIKPLVAFLGLALTGAVLIWSAIEYIVIEDDFRVVRFEQLNIGQTPAAHAVPEVRLLTQLGVVLTGARIQLAAGMAPDQLAQVRALALRYPWTATQYRYAVALALNGQPEEAIRQMQVIRAQRGERLYQRVRAQFVELGSTRHPELLRLSLP